MFITNIFWIHLKRTVITNCRLVIMHPIFFHLWPARALCSLKTRFKWKWLLVLDGRTMVVSVWKLLSRHGWFGGVLVGSGCPLVMCWVIFCFFFCCCFAEVQLPWFLFASEWIPFISNEWLKIKKYRFSYKVLWY